MIGRKLPHRGRLTPTRLLMATCALLAIATFGCGKFRHADSTDSSKRFLGEKHNIAAVIERFSRAVGRQDWARICDGLYSARFKDSNTGLIAHSSCAEGLQRSYGSDRFNHLDLEVSSVNFDAFNAATAFSKSRQGGQMTFGLIKAAGRWRIDSEGGTLP